MTTEQGIWLNIELSKSAAYALTSHPIEGIQIDSIHPLQQSQRAKFGLGIGEVVTAIALVKGVMELVKLALEIQKTLKEQEQQTGSPNQKAFLGTPDGRVLMEITPKQKPEQIEEVVTTSFSKSEQ